MVGAVINVVGDVVVGTVVTATVKHQGYFEILITMSEIEG